MPLMIPNLRVHRVEGSVGHDRVRLGLFDDLLRVVEQEAAEEHESSVHRHRVEPRTQRRRRR